MIITVSFFNECCDFTSFLRREKKNQNFAKNCKILQKIRQITACDVLKLTVMIITVIFGPLLEVL